MQKFKRRNLAALAAATFLAGCNSTMIEDTIGSGAGLVATGVIPCSRNDGQPASCQFAVNRQGEGKAQATVTWPDGTSRVIFFENNTAVRSDNAGANFSAEKKAGNTIVRVGNERYEVPDAAIGG
jgi:hypothetical protein